MEIQKYFLLLKKKLKPDLFLIMGLSPAPGVKYWNPQVWGELAPQFLLK